MFAKLQLVIKFLRRLRKRTFPMLGFYYQNDCVNNSKNPLKSSAFLIFHLRDVMPSQLTFTGEK